jgi:hypothetical protein
MFILQSVYLVFLVANEKKGFFVQITLFDFKERFVDRPNLTE